MIKVSFKKSLSVGGFFKVKHLKKVGSTNDYLKSLPQKALREGFCVVADEQIGGKGRLGRKFFSPKGGLYFSILLKPASQEQLDKLTLIAAVATVDAVKSVCGDDASIKWVNDIYIGGKKCSGILAETTENLKGFAIVGIGVNIGDQTLDESIKDIATGVTKKDKNTRWELLATILANFKKLYVNFDAKSVVEHYKNRCSTIGKTVRVFENDGREYTAQAVDIDQNGHLVVRIENQEPKALYSGEVKIFC